MHALARRTGACLPLIGTLGKYVGLIGHDMQTSALKKTWYLSYGLFGCASKSSKFFGGGVVPCPSSQRQISILRAQSYTSKPPTA